MKRPLDNAEALARRIGLRIRRLREAVSLTQEKLAYESGLQSKGTLSKIESGQQLASLAVLELLASRLGVELLDLMIEPEAGTARHVLIEATRHRSTGELDALRRRLVGDAVTPSKAPAPALPFHPAQSTTAGAVPLLGLDIAAGGFEGRYTLADTRWVRPRSRRALAAGCFVARVVGRSMEPTVHDGAWALFSRHVPSDPTGRVVLARYGGLIDADTAASYTLKRFRGVPAPPGTGSTWAEVHLTPDNPAFAPIVVGADRLHELSIVAELLEVLDPAEPLDATPERAGRGAT